MLTRTHRGPTTRCRIGFGCVALVAVQRRYSIVPAIDALQNDYLSVDDS